MSTTDEIIYTFKKYSNYSEDIINLIIIYYNDIACIGNHKIIFDKSNRKQWFRVIARFSHITRPSYITRHNDDTSNDNYTIKHIIKHTAFNIIKIKIESCNDRLSQIIMHINRNNIRSIYYGIIFNQNDKCAIISISSRGYPTIMNINYTLLSIW